MNLRTVIVAAVVSTLSCSGQPPPACPVAVGSPLGFPAPGSPLGFSPVQFSLPNFWAAYTREGGTGACSELAGEEVGFQKFETPNEPDKTTVAIRPFTLSYTHGNPNGFGALEFADFDPSNDEGGELVPDPVFRIDPSDPDGAKINAIGKLPPKPGADSTCAVTEVSVSEQSFREEVLPLVPGGTASARGIVDADAGTVTFPALTIRYQWSDLKIVSTGEVPGAIFTAKLAYTEDACTATYNVQGVWPITLCHLDLDCSPNPLPDATDTEISIPARRFQGSGLNPAFADEEHPFRCNNDPAVHAYTANYLLTDFNGDPIYGVTDWGICEMTKAVSDFTAAQ